MLTVKALGYYDTKKELADALGLTKGAISQWGEVVPEGQAYKLQSITDGALQVDPSCYEKPSTITASHVREASA